MGNALLGVLLVDDDPLVRAGLRTILSAAGDLRVVGEAGDGEEAVNGVRAGRPDVVLMDVRMPGLDGISATGRISALPAPPKVIVLTTFQLDEYVFGAVRLVAAGEAMLSPSVTRTLIERFGADQDQARRAAAQEAVRALTGREREVAAEVARGRSNAEIAACLYMSEATVKAHVSRVMAKLGAANRVQVALTARDAGLA